MQYTLLSRMVKEHAESDGSPCITCDASLFVRLVTAALRAKGLFDPQFYIERNPDVRKALASGVVSDAAEHYYSTGYFEGRMPSRILVNEQFYLDKNEDVRLAVLEGRVENAQKHFDQAGFREGRQPYAGFSLLF